MKLLQKSAVDRAKATDRQREIEEGKKLASRVDGLRETVAEEEASLQQFRVKTLSAINDEILVETTKRDTLKAEVADLEQKRTQALIPLDEAWGILKTEQTNLQQEKERMYISLEELKKSLADHEVAKTKLAEEKEVVQLTHQDADRRLSESATMMSNAERQNTLASDTLRKAEQESQKKMATANERDAWVAMREATAFAKEEELRKKEIDLAKDWSLLKDRQKLYQSNKK